MGKALQLFSNDYLRQCQQMTSTDIVQFLENFRKIQFEPGQLKHINVRIPENVLTAFKQKAAAEGVLYQKKLRELLTEWALS